MWLEMLDIRGLPVEKSIDHVGTFAGSCEPGSRCRPNECIFGSGKPGGGRDFGMSGI